jgi:hypothetical protein
VKDVLAGGVDQYDAVFLPGGHGIVFDGNNSDLKALLEKFWNGGKVVSGADGGSTSWGKAQEVVWEQDLPECLLVTGISSSFPCDGQATVCRDAVMHPDWRVASISALRACVLLCLLQRCATALLAWSTQRTPPETPFSRASRQAPFDAFSGPLSSTQP